MTDYLKYITKLKTEDIPDYEYLKTLTFKLAQKIYLKNDVFGCFDWAPVPEAEQSGYRAKMLSYFFNPNSQVKKLSTNQ